ncbi:MAG: DUF1569 domain-containing protein [Myxococcaceae bacterium]|nr:DUF1569 domain-containing protein [Myxococcaceae bacterium]
MSAPRRLATLEAALVEARAISNAAPPGFGAAMAHCAQSIVCSIDGYPKPAGWLVRAVLGPLVLRRFLRQGFMRHDTRAPVPGLAPPEASLDAAEGLARLEAAVARFSAHGGTLAPHFAYGAVSRDAYEAVHAMHVANHLDALTV